VSPPKKLRDKAVLRFHLRYYLVDPIGIKKWSAMFAFPRLVSTQFL
jgi:hypothetical protein